MKTPVSYHQQRLWFIDHFEKDYLYEGGPIYHNIPLFFEVEECFNEEIIKQSFVKLLQKHEVLRTRVINENDQLFQEVSEIDIMEIDTMLAKQVKVYTSIETLRIKPFDFNKEHLIKLYYENGNDYTKFLFIVHHILVDRNSMLVIQNDFLNFLNNPESEVRSTISYQKFLDQDVALNTSEENKLFNYWQRKLEDLQVLFFPTDNERVPVHIYNAAQKTFSLDKEEVLSFCETHEISSILFTLTSYKLALSQLTDQSDIAIGTLMDLRSDNTKDVVGPIENIVVLRTIFNDEFDMLEACNLVDRTLKEAEKHKVMPFDKLVRDLNPKKDMSRTALFDILFLYDELEENQVSKNNDIIRFNQGLGKYDFNLLVEERPESFKFLMTYNSLYFKEETVDNLMNTIKKNLLRNIEESRSMLDGIDIF